MNVAYLDSSADDICHFENIIKDISCVSNLYSFSNLRELTDFILTNRVDMVFSEVFFEGGNLFELSHRIKSVSPDTNIVFVTKTADYAVDAFEIGACGYILKPCRKEKILLPLNRFGRKLPDVRIKTFGNFDLFVDNTVVMFSNKKAKEMLALLTDKCGGSLNMEQIVDVLWEDRPYNESTKVLYRIALKDLRDTLRKYNCSHILIESRRQRSLDVTKVSCDYYDYLKDSSSSVFNGEYMTNYSWGEYTLAKIVKIPYIS